MAIPNIKYPVDLTGESTTNRVMDERRVVPENGYWGFVPTNGSFYTHNLHVIHVATNKRLIPHLDYLCVGLNVKATQLSHFEVCSAILLKNQAYQGELRLDYNVVGGDYSINGDLIQELLEQAINDGRPVLWGRILNKPDGFVPSGHLHDILETYRWEHMVYAVNRLGAILEQGDQWDHADLRNAIDNLRLALAGLSTELMDALIQHMSDKRNPHMVTALQIGLELLHNYPITHDPVNNPETYASGQAVYKAMEAAKGLNDIVIKTNSVLQINRSHIVLANVVLEVPDPNDISIPEGARIEVRKLTTVSPYFNCPNGLMVTINGEDSQVGFDVNTDVSLIHNPTTKKWEVSAAGYLA